MKQAVIWKVILASSLMIAAVAAQVTGSVTLSQNTVYTGEEVYASVKVHNHGESPLKDLTVKLEMSPELGPGSMINLPSLAGGTTYSKEFEIQTLQSTPLGQYNVTAYAVHGTQEVKVGTAVLTLTGFPLYITHKAEKGVMGSGESNSLTVTIGNNGTITFTNTSLEVELPSQFYSNESGVLLIGYLTPHQEVKKEFRFQVSEGIAGDFHIPIKLVFYDDVGRHAYQVSAQVSVSGGGIGLFETLLLIVIVVIAVRLLMKAR